MAESCIAISLINWHILYIYLGGSPTELSVTVADHPYFYACLHSILPKGKSQKWAQGFEAVAPSHKL